jgi:metal-sulfur cluster biosynthetic enzyme
VSDPVDLARDRLKQVVDPEAALNIVDLGLVYDIRRKDDALEIDMTFTTEACPVGPSLLAEMREVLKDLPGIARVDINVVFDPPWSPERISPDGRALLEGGD